MPQSQNNAVMAGLLIGIAFFIARVSMVRNPRGFLLAVGSALMEIAIVLFLDRKARQLEAGIDQWWATRDALGQADAFLKAAAEEVELRSEFLKEIRQSIATIEIEHLQGRVWGSDLEIDKSLAVAALRSGYQAGVAENRAASIIPREAA